MSPTNTACVVVDGVGRRQQVHVGPRHADALGLGPGQVAAERAGAEDGRVARTAGSARARRTSTTRTRCRTPPPPGRPGAKPVTSGADRLHDARRPRDPARRPGATGAFRWRKCRSEPQIAARVTRTTASVGSHELGLGHIVDPHDARPRRTRPRARRQSSSGNRVGTVLHRWTSSSAAFTYRTIVGRSPRTRSLPCIIARTGSSSPRTTSFQRE